jgi:GTP pyrophosphokinase
MSFDQLLEKARGYLPPEKVAAVKEAYEYAVRAHEGQMRKSGEPYIEHPLQVAITLADLQLDASSLAAAFLHDVLENCGVELDEIKSKFGPEVAKLVDGVTKLGKLSFQAPEETPRRGRDPRREGQAENLRKMLVAMAEDLRVVFIKLADRLHNMQTLGALEPKKQRSIAQETIEVYARWLTASASGIEMAARRPFLPHFSPGDITRLPGCLPGAAGAGILHPGNDANAQPGSSRPV